jgi:hypothetical protein
MDKYTVFDSLGVADVAASANAYAKALTAWKEANEIPTARIEAAVEAVFDRAKGRLSMPALISFAVNELSQDPSVHKNLSERVRAYVTSQKKAGRLTVTQGKNGGVTRVALPGQSLPKKPA